MRRKCNLLVLRRDTNITEKARVRARARYGRGEEGAEGEKYRERISLKKKIIVKYNMSSNRNLNFLLLDHRGKKARSNI